MKRFSPDMEVVRFGAEDIIVTSGAAVMVLDSLMGDGIKGNGTVTFNGVPYLLDNVNAAQSICTEITNIYGNNGDQTIIDNGNKGELLRNILYGEVQVGYDPGWVGSYTYDANSNKFNKQ